MNATADAVVIGAGVIGSSIALELRRAGRSVLVVDKAGGLGLGSTSSSSAIVRFNYSTWPGVAASWESWHGWQSWADHLGHRDESGLARFVRTGSLVIARDRTGFTATGELFDRAGIPWEIWDSTELHRRVPALDAGSYGPPKPIDTDEFFADADGGVSAFYCPEAGYVDDPQLAAHNLGSAARQHGADYRLATAVVAIEPGPQGTWEVSTATGDTISAQIVVNAAGPWSGRINRLAGVGADFSVSTRPLRQEVHQVPTAGGFGSDAGPAITMLDADLGVYLRSTPGESLLIGGTEPECDPLEWIEDPDLADPRVSAAQFQTQVTRAARRLPELRIPSHPKGIAGVYDVTPDWTPIYDRTAAPGFYVAIGTSGNQFKNAPVVGALMTRLIEVVESGHDHDRSPVDFTAPRTGLSMDLGAFSRLRSVATDAPRSVLG